ncbi:HtaA domain-containing protein [Leucobacter sp. BZR 635]
MTQRTARRVITVGLAAGLLGGTLLGPANPAGAATRDAAQQCTVEAAELRWGVKERFRNYISGSIANGEWVTEGGVTYETPTFEWQNGEGSVEADLRNGRIEFAGQVHFTGHGGAMQLDLQDPSLVFTGPTTAQLVMDMGSVDTEGTRLELQPVVAADVDLAGAATGDGSSYTIENAPVRLTAAGAVAFNGEYGDYSEGELLDGLALSFSLPGCTITADTGTAAPPVAEPQPGDPSEEAAAPEIPWLLIALGGLALVAIGVTTALLFSGRKRSPAQGEDVEASTGPTGAEPTDTD